MKSTSSLPFTLALFLASSPSSAQDPDIGALFTVNDYTTAVQSSPRACTTASGDFVVAWGEPGSYRYGPQGRNDSGLFGRRVSASGTPLASQSR